MRGSLPCPAPSRFGAAATAGLLLVGTPLLVSGTPAAGSAPIQCTPALLPTPAVTAATVTAPTSTAPAAASTVPPTATATVAVPTVAVPKSVAGQPATAVPVAGGFLLSPPEYSFEVTFPGLPTSQRTEAVRPEDGVTETATLWILEYPNGILVMSVVEGSVTDVLADDLVDIVEQELMPAVDATLMSCSDVVVSGQPGLDFTGAIASGGTYVGRIFFVDARTYQVVYAGADGSEVLDSLGPMFRDSFSFVGALAR